MRMRKNKNSDENFTSLLSAIDRYAVAPDQEFLKQIRERSAREFAAGAPEVSTNTPKSIHIAALRSIIMKSPITKLATAAIVAIACMIGLSLWRGTESGIALADVLAAVEKVKAYGFKCDVWSTTDPNEPYNTQQRLTILVSQEYGSKCKGEQLDPNGKVSTFQGETYFLPKKKATIEIIPKEKRFLRTEVDDTDVEQMQRQPGTVAAMNDFLREMLRSKHEGLGRSTIDGIEVAGFRTTDPNLLTERGRSENFQCAEKLWVDVKTLLPVRSEHELFRQVGVKKDHVMRWVFYDYQWDVPVDVSDFEPVIPEGYTLRLVKFPPHITEETAIQGLKLWFQLLGKYPDTKIITNKDNVAPTVLHLAEKSETPAAMQLKEDSKGLTDDQISNKLVDFLIPIRGVARFYVLLYQDKKDPAYYGKIVTPKDADKVLLRWKVSDNEYRVIFGDLHAETVTKAKLAELEAALPK